MNVVYIIVFVLITIAIIWGIVALAPSVVAFHRDSLRPISNLFGNKEAVATVAAAVI